MVPGKLVLTDIPQLVIPPQSLDLTCPNEVRVQPVQQRIENTGSDSTGSANGGNGEVGVWVALLPSLPEC